MTTLRIYFLLFCVLFFNIQTAECIEVPPLSGRVNDSAKMLSSSTLNYLEIMLQELEEKEGTQIAVLTIPSLQGAVLEEFSLKVAETWQLGQKEDDNGALLLISKNDRKIRIEVGYGLEGTLTDLTAGRIIRNIITPKFKNGAFNQGVIDGVEAMVDAAKGEFSASEIPDDSESWIIPYIFFGIFLFILYVFALAVNFIGDHRKFSTILGGIIIPFISWFGFGSSWLSFLIFIPCGLFLGFLISWLINKGSFNLSGGGPYISSKAGVSGGGSSFSGGGGGFGGGGSSGGW